MSSSPSDCLFLHGFLSPHRSQWMNRTLTLMWVHWQTCTLTRTSTRARRTRRCWRTSNRLSRVSRCSPDRGRNNKCKAKTTTTREKKGQKEGNWLFFAAVIYHSYFISSAVMLSTPWVSLFFLLLFLIVVALLWKTNYQRFKQTFTFCTFSYDLI